MAASVLVAYATRYGSTQEVAQAVAATLGEVGLEIDMQPMRSVGALAGYRAVVLGAPLYMSHWHKDARRFLSQHRADLTKLPVAVFALGPIHGPAAEKEWRDARRQLDQDLAQFMWLTPVAAEVFGGSFDPARLRFPWTLLPGRKKLPAGDARDWPAIRAWAGSLAATLQPIPV